MKKLCSDSTSTNDGEGSSFLKFSAVSAGYPQKRLREISFRLECKQKAILLGANGSGKTSILEVVSRLLNIEEGTLSCSDNVSYAAHQSFLYKELTVKENLYYFHSLLREDVSLLEEMIDCFELDSLMNKRTNELSQGQKSRVILARTFMNCGADIFCFDEPTSALDDRMTQKFIEATEEYLPTKIVLLATHDQVRMRDFADLYLVMHEGRLIESTSNGEQAFSRYYQLNR